MKSEGYDNNLTLFLIDGMIGTRHLETSTLILLHASINVSL